MNELLTRFSPFSASQPQNCIFGQFVSLFIAYGFGRSAIDRRVKACLSTSLSITVMARLGITHPPAGASAMLFSSGDHSLAQIGAMLLGNVIAVVLGTWFNNLSDKRQYPTAWFPLCNGQMDSTCWTCEQEKAAPSNTAPTLKSMNTRRPAQAPLRSSKEMHKAKNPILVPNVTQAAAALAANEKKEAQSPVDNHERPPLLQAIASFVTGEASKAIDEKSSPGNEDIHSSRSSGSNEGNIDLKTVLHQAHNPTFIIDHGDNVTNRSVFRISTAFHNTDGSLRYRQYVMNEHSQSNNSGTIDLSEVLATAARQSNSSNLGAAANQTFIRLPEDGRSKKDDGHSLSLNCRDPDGLMNAPSANISSTMESFDEVMQNVDSDDELSVIEA